MKHIKIILSAFLCTALLCSCSLKEHYTSYSLFAMNTIIEVQFSPQNYDLSKTEQHISHLEQTLSRTIQESDISQINANRSHKVSDTTYMLLEKSKKLYTDTNGAFDVCSGALTQLWNISGGNTQIPSQNDILCAVETCGADSLTLKDATAYLTEDGTLVDLGGIAKGYAAQTCIELMKQTGVKNAMISFGGNVAVTGASQNNASKGKDGWVIGIKNPDNAQEAVGHLTLTDTVIAVSGDYERYFEKDGKRYCHIFDAKSGYPANSGIRSAAVICKDGAVADALSTALFVMGAKDALDFYNSGLYNFEAILITSDGKVLLTDKVSKDFTPNSNAKNKDAAAYSYITLSEYVNENLE